MEHYGWGGRDWVGVVGAQEGGREGGGEVVEKVKSEAEDMGQGRCVLFLGAWS